MQLDVAPSASLKPREERYPITVEVLDPGTVKEQYPDRWKVTANRHPRLDDPNAPIS
ncbi:hypothetical protein HY407_00475 [Candidatus Gottesmanbacteria bacterium]|nr:hypothetical protein [Candidatus Gottesmanbacteria bacterium]